MMFMIITAVLSTSRKAPGRRQTHVVIPHGEAMVPLQFVFTPAKRSNPSAVSPRRRTTADTVSICRDEAMAQAFSLWNCTRSGPVSIPMTKARADKAAVIAAETVTLFILLI